MFLVKWPLKTKYNIWITTSGHAYIRYYILQIKTMLLDYFIIYE